MKLDPETHKERMATAVSSLMLAFEEDTESLEIEPTEEIVAKIAALHDMSPSDLEEGFKDAIEEFVKGWEIGD